MQKTLCPLIYNLRAVCSLDPNQTLRKHVLNITTIIQMIAMLFSYKDTLNFSFGSNIYSPPHNMDLLHV